MAVKGESVECNCGAKLLLANDRVPWHKDKKHVPKPGLDPRDCRWSGVSAENWEPLPGAEVKIGGFTLACPECKSKGHIRNAPKESIYPLACGKCGTFGTLEEFVGVVANSGRKHRYVG